MGKINYAEWKILLWRLIRTAFATAVGQIVLLQPDWTKPEETIKFLVVSLVSGFIVALGKGIRDQWGNPDQTGTINKLPL